MNILSKGVHVHGHVRETLAVQIEEKKLLIMARQATFWTHRAQFKEGIGV
jgi:hypothetical protein